MIEKPNSIPEESKKKKHAKDLKIKKDLTEQNVLSREKEFEELRIKAHIDSDDSA